MHLFIYLNDKKVTFFLSLNQQGENLKVWWVLKIQACRGFYFKQKLYFTFSKPPFIFIWFLNKTRVIHFWHCILLVFLFKVQQHYWCNKDHLDWQYYCKKQYTCTHIPINTRLQLLVQSQTNHNLISVQNT